MLTLNQVNQKNGKIEALNVCFDDRAILSREAKVLKYVFDEKYTFVLGY